MNSFLFIGCICLLFGLYLFLIGIVGFVKKKVIFLPYEQILKSLARERRINIRPEVLWSKYKERSFIYLFTGLILSSLGLFIIIIFFNPLIMLEQDKINLGIRVVWFLTVIIYVVYVPFVIRSQYCKKFIIGVAIAFPFSGFFFIATSSGSFAIAIYGSLWFFMLVTMAIPFSLSYYEDLTRYRKRR